MVEDGVRLIDNDTKVGDDNRRRIVMPMTFYNYYFVYTNFIYN